ncbi:MAG: helix-turn-helix domain-containing protein [Desulfovibrio sp.]|uniref:helix-turn-helix domain-containing protein n=1 Tax=Desulfovibrio sp. TaxID=885 RepID=UPI001A65143C|nr:RodZ domain-containing protein [Desulfovibrio sp.]MBD5417635.1 helix-turn-helix domain-containing protein [Desulfovibrio sp.]
MNFDELGAALRAERERRGLRIEDAADHLKISARHLRALEEGDAASLPHPAYARGFIRSYAAYLGMSPEEIHNALNGVSAPEAAAPKAPLHMAEPAPATRHSGGGSGGKGALVILVLLLVAAGAYAGWRWGLPLLSGLEQQRLAQPSPPLSSAQPAPVVEPVKKAESARPQSPRSAQPAPAAPVQQVQPQAQRDETAPPAPQAGQQAAPARTEPARPAAVTSRQEEQGAPAATPAASTAGASSVPGQETAAAPAQAGDEAAAPGQHKVIITATEECWIHSNADKTDTRQFSLRKGDTFALTFARSLELKLGNAGGVRIRYDGQSMPPAGQSGQVRTLTFPPQDGQ